MKPVTPIWTLVLMAVIHAVPASAQTCVPQWWDNSENLRPEIGGITPYVMREYDRDGIGPLARHLYVAGIFSFDVNGIATPGIGRWDGFEWTPVGQGIGAGGINVVIALSGFDPDGAGSANAVLIAGGLFANAGNVVVQNIAQWNGTTWSGMGTAIPAAQVVYAAEPHDPDGAGPLPGYLAVAGSFTSFSNGTPANLVARWDGGQWHNDIQLPTSITAPNSLRCFAFRSFDPDGDGPQLPVLLAWVGPGPYHIYRWTGTEWVFTNLTLAPVSGALYDTSSPSVEWDSDGAGPAGSILYVCEPTGLHKWSAGGWQAVPNSAGGGSLLATGDEDGPGPLPVSLYSVTASNEVRRFAGSGWTTIGMTAGPPKPGASGKVYCLQGFDSDGPGPRPSSLFVGGSFGTVSGVPAHGLARYGCEETSSPCVGDANDDLVVDFDDLTEVLTFWGIAGSPGFEPEADLNFDGVVGFTDITAVLTSWGGDCGAGRSVAAAPPVALDPSTPMGRLMRVHQEEGFGGVTRALAEWPIAE